jgi:hypothetical protein
MWETRNGGDSTASEERGERERERGGGSDSLGRSIQRQRHQPKAQLPKQRQHSKEIKMYERLRWRIRKPSHSPVSSLIKV